MGRGLVFRNRLGLFFILIAGLLMMGPVAAWAADTVCARVKIEIKQELTLERQAFDAHMRINNGLANISLADVKVEVSFTDEDSSPVLASSDPDNTAALFFIRLDSMDNISDVGGTGTVGPSSSADIHWLIIPAPGSSNGLEKGTLYYVGAKLTYTIGGEQKVTEVTPDYIFVKPMPEITLDYFLPSDVYGDDPFTAEIEPTIPFSLGVRVKNSGHGVARKLKIDSAQPKITENEQGLLIGFAIEGSEVNGQPASDSLLVDFGDISPNSSGMARWIMTCSLSGKFVSFTADFSHSDELGGELTSLIKAVNTHFLVQDVIVDLSGRDAVRDFLARDDSVYRIYESEVTGLGDPADEDPVVADQSDTAALTGSGNTRTLKTAVTTGFMVVQLADPFGGQKGIKEVVRSDGKIIKPANAWLSHTRVKNDPWQYFFNLFDVNSPGAYTLKFEDASAVALPPVLQFIAPKTVAEGEQASFIVEASDPNGTLPKLAAVPLPAGASFVDEGSGRGIFDWTPAEGQAGVYEVIFSASDGALEATRRATITVQGFRDTDGDGIDDDWEMKHFGTLERDGSGDYDRDGISDLDEFLNQTDPAALADLVIRQTADKMNPVVGDTVTLTVTATNNGPRDATGVLVTDLLSSGLTYLSDDSGGSYDPVSGIWDIEDLSATGPDNTATLNITAEVMRSGRIVNIAALTDTDLYDPDRSNNSAGLILNGGIQSDLALAQTINNPMPEVGDTIAVYIKVTNNGVDDATGVQITDGLPGGLTFSISTASQGIYDPITGIWDVGDLNTGDSAALHLTLTVTETAEIINTAVITRIDQRDPDPTNNRCSLVLNQDPENHPYVADLAVYKLVNQEAVPVGDPAAYTIVVRNLGPDDAGDVEIDDLLPQGAAYLSTQASQGTYAEADGLWQAGTVAAGSYVIMDTLVEVTAADEQTNTAVIGNSSEFDPDPGNDSATGSVTGLAADIALTKTVDRATANVGQPVVFTITAVNHGPDDAVGVEVVDEVPSGLIYQSDQASQGIFDPGTGQWDIGDLAKGSSVTLQIIFQVETSGEMINRITLKTSSPTDTDADNNSAQVTLIGNAPPIVDHIPDLTIEEGISFATIKLDDYVADDNNGVEEMTWSFSGNDPLSIRIDDDRIATIEVPHINWNGSETITFTATDPFGVSDEDEILFTVTAVNDAPVNMLPGSQITPEDTGLVISPSISISDIDAGSGDLMVMLTATHGKLTLVDTAYLTFMIGDGTADAALTFSGTIPAINTALAGMRFDPDADYFGDALIEIRTNDQGHSGAGGSRIDMDTINLSITAVNDPPQAALAGPVSGDEGRAVTFSGSAVDIDSDALTYSWDFDYNGSFTADASDIALSAAQWTYNDNGTYTVALRVEDKEGGSSDIVTAVVTVNNVAPVAEAGTDQAVAEGASVEFAASFTEPGADTHTIDWGFGDGSTASGILTPKHAYADDGTYTVTLTVTDDDGGVGTDTLTVTVNNAPPVADAGADQTANEGQTVNFSGSYTDAGLLDTHTISWNFGDGAPLLTETLAPTHVYTDDGTYSVTLMVTDNDGGTGTDTLTVTVNNTAPTVEAGSDQNAVEGEPVHFSAAFTDPGGDTHTIEWNFGDGTLLSGTLTPVHTYGNNSTYTVTLTVTDDDGGVGTDTLAVEVFNAAPEISDLTANSPSNGAISLTAAFTDPGWFDSHSARCEFGDGTAAECEVAEENEKPDATGTLAAVHNYAAEGLFTLSVTVTDDDGAGSGPRTMEVLIDTTPPLITVFEPQAGYYHNTGQINLDLAVEDPESNGVSSGLVAQSVVVTLDGRKIAPDEILDLSTLADGPHTLHVAASDYAGNTAEQEVSFEVGPVPAMAAIQPQRWNLSWLNPFEGSSGHLFWDWFTGNTPVTATISFENVEAETILPTFAASMLRVGRAYGDFVVAEVVPAPDAIGHGPARVRSVTLQYSGSEQTDALTFSGDTTWDFYGLNNGDRILLDAGEGEHLGRHTVIAYYLSGPPWYSPADIAPETVLLNGQVPIIAGSAQLITQGPFQLGQSRVSAEPSITIVKEGRRHVWLTNLGHPQTITLKVGNQVIFENESYPLQWHDRFSLEEDGAAQTMGIFASGVSDTLRIFYHNLQAEARILLDGVPALTILPETELVALRVQFDRFEAIASLDPADLESGGGWDVTSHGGVRRLNTHRDRHILLTDLGQPQTIKLVVSDTVIFEDLVFPLNWRNRCFIVDGERQDMSIYTWGQRHRDKFMSVHLGKLSRPAKLYLDDSLVLEISPPPVVEVSLTGRLEFDGDPATFEGSFTAADKIELKGSLPDGYDIDKHYQRINSSGSPELQIGDRFGDMEVVDFTAGYDDYRITGLEFRYDGWKIQQINVYGDSRRNHLLETQEVNPGDTFVVDTREIEADRIYLKAGHHQRTVDLTGKWAAEIRDTYLDCTVTDLSQVPVGPPHYIDLTLGYTGPDDPVHITAYDGHWQALIDTFDIDPTVDPIFTIDGSGLADGHIGDNLVLEYGSEAASK